MTECVVCDRKFEKNILFEDKNMIIMLAIEPCMNGHIQIFSKTHYTILEQVPDNVLNLIMDASNKMSMVLFEVLKVHGTNIIINNGVPAGQKIAHFSVDIIPRRNDDALKLDWELKQASPESLETMHRIISEGAAIPVPKRALEEPVAPPEDKPVPKNIEKEKSLEIETMAREGRSTVKKISEEEHQSHVHRKHPAEEKKTNYHHHLFDRVP